MKAIALLILVGVVILASLLSKTEAFVDNNDSRKSNDRYNDYQFKGKTNMKQTPEGPYARESINDIDDYENQLVDRLSSWRKINDRTAKEITRRQPFVSDWSQLPPDSNQFQIKRQDFVNGIYNKPYPDNEALKMLEGKDVFPPNQDQLDADENKLMASYAPQKSAGLTKYSIEDAKDFIHKYYDKQGKVPEIVEDPKFPNVYQVVGVQDKNPKITWEPEAPSSSDAVDYLGENTINVPQVAVDRADPFFFGEGKGYKSWTPGLERMFAPTYAKSSWY
jgi:hypothetical protein